MVHRLQFILLLVLLVTSCAPMPVKIDREQSFDLGKHKTYTLIPNEQDEIDVFALDKSAIDAIVTNTIESQLAEKHYQKSADNAELLLSYYLVVNAKTDFFVINDYYGNLGFHAPGRSATRDSFHLQETTYEEGILIIDVIDASSKQRIWQGYLTSRMDIYRKDERNEQRLRNGVSKILNYFPSSTL